VSLRVLLVEAKDGARSGLAKRLDRSAAISLVGVAHDLPEAKALAVAMPDLILVDLHEGSGHDSQLCQTLVDALSSPVVVLTSFMTRDRWSDLHNVGVSTYLLRHINTRRLVDELNEVSHQYEVPDKGEAQ